jgi:hypothetical protein
MHNSADEQNQLCEVGLGQGASRALGGGITLGIEIAS